jgi:hypothetical protein
MAIQVAAAIAGYTEPKGDVCTAVRFKKGDKGVIEKASTVHPECLYVIWERDLARLPRLVKRTAVRVIEEK